MEANNKKNIYRSIKDESLSTAQLNGSLDSHLDCGYYLVEINNKDRLELCLPVDKCSNEHYLKAHLFVTDSGNEDELQKNRVIGQTLVLSQCDDGKTSIYSRSYSSIGDGYKWSLWSKAQQDVQVGQVASLDGFTSSGLYSGVYSVAGRFPETFVLTVIDNDASATAAGKVRSISQFKYAVNVEGIFSYMTRVGRGDVNVAWGNWVDIGAADTTDIQDASITTQKLSDDVRVKIEQIVALGDLKNKALQTDSVNITLGTDNVHLCGKSIDSNGNMMVCIPAATTEKAGVMSAEHVQRLGWNKLSTLSNMFWANSNIKYKNVDSVLPTKMQGKFLNHIGEISETSNMEYWLYAIPVKAGDIYKITANTSPNSNAVIATYNNGKCVDIIDGYTSFSNYIYIPSGIDTLYFQSGQGECAQVVKCEIVDMNKFLYESLNEIFHTDTVIVDKMAKEFSSVVYGGDLALDTENNTFIDSVGEVRVGGGDSFVTSVADVSDIRGHIVEIKGSSLGQNCHYIIVDDSEKLVYKVNDNDETEYTQNTDYAVIPANAKRVVISGLTTLATPSLRLVTELKKKKKWSSLKWVCVGDSLTEHNLRATKNYHDYISEETGIEVINMGKSGTGYKRTEDEGKAFYQRVSDIPADADVITIFGSGNDTNTQVLPKEKLGTSTDIGTDTIGGCINTTLDNIFSRIPLAVVGIISPTPWVGAMPNDGTTQTQHWEEYVKLIEDICKLRGIPYLDLYHSSGLRPNDTIFRSLAYSKDEGNGVHPDENGHKLIASRFKAFLSCLIR